MDCDDSNDNIAPDEEDRANGIDDNCNGLIDEGEDDQDGYNEAQGIAMMERTCLSRGYELPNDIDDDCDGIVDENTDVYLRW